MAGSKGYYSLIQYCPDQSRLEVANIGVLLYCPELHFLKTRMASGHDRERTIFNVSGDDLRRIELAKQAIADRVAVENEDFRSLEGLQKFVLTRGNDIVLTQPRPMRVMNPAEDLASLFEELVGGRTRSIRKSEPTRFPEIEKAFQADGVKNRIARDLHIQLPLTEQQIIIPYAFRNGKQNLIKPQRFSSEKKDAFSKASHLSFEGSLLYKHAVDGINCELIVVSKFADPSRSIMSTVDELFRDYNVRHVPLERLGELTEEIMRAAH